MKKKWILPVVLFATLLTSCGGSESAEETTSTEENQGEEAPKELIKNYDYFSQKLDNIQIEGLTLTKNLVNDDPTYGDLRRSWNVDPSKDGCDEIQINTTDLTKMSNRSDNDFTSLANFEEITRKYLSEGVECSNFKEYVKDDSLHFYYCTMKGCKKTFGPQNFNEIYFRHTAGGSLGVTGWIYVYDNTMDLTQAEQVAIKTMDFIAKP